MGIYFTAFSTYFVAY